MLIREIEPIGNTTVNLLEESSNDLIDKIVELPLREVCRILKQAVIIKNVNKPRNNS